MIRDFSREELEPVASNHTELTLGLGTVLGLGAGLLLLCIVCFGLGYAVGHHANADQNAAIVVPDRTSNVTSAKSGSKPGASREAAALPSSDGTSGDSQPADAVQATGDSPSNAASSEQVAGASTPQVRPALPGSSESQTPSPVHVQPATSQVQGWMVQIAAVSRSEDADVLINALKKRGYTVTARRELGDSLIHVQTGPFASRNDANTMRQKLLSDGYNAIVQ